MIAHDHVWAGRHNLPLDVTGLGADLDPPGKLEIARALGELRVDRIESGFRRIPADDFEAFRLIMDAGLRALASEL